MSATVDARALAFVQEQAAGEWDDKTIQDDALRLTDLLKAVENDALERGAHSIELRLGLGAKYAEDIRSLKHKDGIQ